MVLEYTDFRVRLRSLEDRLQLEDPRIARTAAPSNEVPWCVHMAVPVIILLLRAHFTRVVVEGVL